jgi:Protein of unknown function (DUF3489)
MSKSTNKRSIAKSNAAAKKPQQQIARAPETSRRDRSSSKQSRVLAMLQSPTGVTIAAIMKATGWQQHSVRGFLAGVVRRRLNLKLISKKVDDQRIYQVGSGVCTTPDSRKSKSRAA